MHEADIGRGPGAEGTPASPLQSATLEPLSVTEPVCHPGAKGTPGFPLLWSPWGQSATTAGSAHVTGGTGHCPTPTSVSGLILLKLLPKPAMPLQAAATMSSRGSHLCSRNTCSSSGRCAPRTRPQPAVPTTGSGFGRPSPAETPLRPPLSTRHPVRSAPWPLLRYFKPGIY